MMMSSLRSLVTLLMGIIALNTIFFSPQGAFVEALYENERLEGYHKRNYTWPPTKYKPNTEGWRKLNEHRFRQIAEIDDSDKRYEAYLQTVNSAYVADNFTRYGFGLARAPDDLMEALRKGIHKGIEMGPRLEPDIEVIEGGLRPWFIDRPDLTKRVLKQLQVRASMNFIFALKMHSRLPDFCE